MMKTITIYHNPKCSKSRKTLAILNATNCAIEIIEYLKVRLIKLFKGFLFDFVHII